MFKPNLFKNLTTKHSKNSVTTQNKINIHGLNSSNINKGSKLFFSNVEFGKTNIFNPNPILNKNSMYSRKSVLYRNNILLHTCLNNFSTKNKVNEKPIIENTCLSCPIYHRDILPYYDKNLLKIREMSDCSKKEMVLNEINYCHNFCKHCNVYQDCISIEHHRIYYIASHIEEKRKN